MMGVSTYETEQGHEHALICLYCFHLQRAVLDASLSGPVFSHAVTFVIDESNYCWNRVVDIDHFLFSLCFRFAITIYILHPLDLSTSTRSICIY